MTIQFCIEIGHWKELLVDSMILSTRNEVALVFVLIRYVKVAIYHSILIHVSTLTSYSKLSILSDGVHDVHGHGKMESEACSIGSFPS